MHLHAVPNPYTFLYSFEQKREYLENVFFFPHKMKISGPCIVDPFLFGLTMPLKS